MSARWRAASPWKSWLPAPWMRAPARWSKSAMPTGRRIRTIRAPAPQSDETDFSQKNLTRENSRIFSEENADRTVVADHDILIRGLDQVKAALSDLALETIAPDLAIHPGNRAPHHGALLGGLGREHLVEPVLRRRFPGHHLHVPILHR